ncbi:MAG TPA: CocE/NonD family hydrolase [Solirubrobacterales bacterium]
MKGYRGLLAALAVVVALVIAPAGAQAAIPSVYAGAIECKVQPSYGNVRLCGGYKENPADSANTFIPSWDGTKIDVNVILPPESGGAEGPYPLIGDFHGWGGSKQGLSTVEPGTGLTFEQDDPRVQQWAEEGYAVFSMSDRGWGLSCGKYDLGKALANCEKGYNHLMDDRYEVRDAQYLMSILAAEGVVEPTKIGVTGKSYGGGMSMALASLRNRVMEPSGELVPWVSPKGQEMEIAAAVPQWPWTDLAYSLAPNGRNLDYATNSPYRGPSGTNPIGVMKFSWDFGLYLQGEALSNYSETDEQADIPAWIERLYGGDPYTDKKINRIINQLTEYHSSFYIDHAEEPSPLLIQSGWNDDLFPVDEALRFYQRTRAQYPGNPISLYLADIGHARSQNKPADEAAFNERLEAWFAHYLKGEGASPSSSVEGKTTICPKSTPSEGPFKAADWSDLQPGEINFSSAGSQTITPPTSAEKEGFNKEFQEEKVVFPGSPSGKAFDPIIGSGVCASIPVEDNPAAANYSLGAAPAGGYNLMGSPTIIANIESPSPNSEIAARLLDVSPSGEESLISRGVYRPDGGTQQIVFQLHPQAYHFAAGHVAKLELLSVDMPYVRWSNLQSKVTVSNLELRLPVMEQPGALGGLVKTPAPKIVPDGYTLAKEFETKPSGGGGGGGNTGGNTTSPKPPAPVQIGVGNLAGKLTANGSVIMVPMSCTEVGACSGSDSFSVKQQGKKNRTTIASADYAIGAGKTITVRMQLTKTGRKIVKEMTSGKHPKKHLNGQLVIEDKGRAKRQTSNRAVELPHGK